MKDNGCNFCDGNCTGQCGDKKGSGSCSCADFVQWSDGTTDDLN